MEFKINLNKISAIKEFVSLMQSIPTNTFLKEGKCVVDAKSIMGIFSLDLSKPITLEIELTPAVTFTDIQNISKKILKFEEEIV